MKTKKLNDYIFISYHKNGNIKKCTSVYDDKETNKPLTESKVHSSYVPLLQRNINEFFKTLTPYGFADTNY